MLMFINFQGAICDCTRLQPQVKMINNLNCSLIQRYFQTLKIISIEVFTWKIISIEFYTWKIISIEVYTWKIISIEFYTWKIISIEVYTWKIISIEFYTWKIISIEVYTWKIRKAEFSSDLQFPFHREWERSLQEILALDFDR